MWRFKFWFLSVLSLLIGLLITWVDSRPGWDDTGITVGAILLVCAGLGMAMPQRAWLWALLVGGWIPLVGIATSQNYAAILALIIAFVGAYIGFAGRKVIAALLGSNPG